MNIPTILESLAADYRNGATWADIAAELYKAGWISHVSIERARRLLSPYLDK